VKKKSWARMFQKLLLNHSSILCLFAIDKPCDEYHRHLFSSCCDLSFVRTWLPCLIIIPCLVYLFHLDQKTLHDSIIRPSLRAVSESSLGAFLKASSSSRGGRQATLLNLPRGSKLPLPALLEWEGIQHLKSDQLPVGQQSRKMCVSQSTTLFS